MKILSRSIVATVIFLLLLMLIYYVHIKYFKVDVIFYAAITDGVLAALLTGGCIFSFNYFKPLEVFSRFLLVVIWLFASYALAISVPTVIDRSLSFYILEKIHQRGGGILDDRIEGVITYEFMKEYRVTDARVTEQLESGTIKIQNGCILLTERGEFISRFSSFFRKNLLPKKRLLLGKYTDHLTNPLEDTAGSADYSCTAKQ